ncbi:MAG: hypothetical protein D6B27_06070 [Gammaproteobacteria bacterium]|nr:MAG: hypothetical protein D6B27_06070 [Gammaproteobacteria bacterium]
MKHKINTLSLHIFLGFIFLVTISQKAYSTNTTSNFINNVIRFTSSPEVLNLTPKNITINLKKITDVASIQKNDTEWIFKSKNANKNKQLKQVSVIFWPTENSTWKFALLKLEINQTTNVSYEKLCALISASLKKKADVTKSNKFEISKEWLISENYGLKIQKNKNLIILKTFEYQGEEEEYD